MLHVKVKKFENFVVQTIFVKMHISIFVSDFKSIVNFENDRQLNFTSLVFIFQTKVKTFLMTNTKISERIFVNRKYIKLHKFFIVRLQKSIKFKLTNDKLVSNIIYMIQIIFSLNSHIDICWCLMTDLSKYNIILSMFWLQKHDFQASFVHRSLTFNFDHCMINCLFNECFIVIYSDDASKKQHKFSDKHKKYDDIYEIFAYAFNQMINKKNHDLIVMWSEHFELLNQSKSDDRYLCVIMINEIIAITAEDYEKFFVKNNKFFLTIDELKKRLLEHYYDRVKIFNFKAINKLSSHKEIDHNIDLQFEAIFSTKKTYGLFREQALIIKTYIENMR